MSTQSPKPPGYRPDWLHQAILFAHLLSDIPPLLISPALAGMAAIGAWPWREPALQIATGSLTLLAIGTDGLSLSLLPLRRRSYGPVTPPLLALALLRAGLTFVLGALWPAWPAMILTTVIQLTLTALQLYATWGEPFRLTVTSVDVASPRLTGTTPLQMIHLSDIHFEGWTPREREVIQRAERLAPHLILLTGDYLSLSTVQDPVAHDGVRELLSALAAIAPTYAITGSPPVDRADVVPAIFAGLPITWLLDDVADLHLQGHNLRLVGLRSTQSRRQDGPRLRQILPDGEEAETFTILLYHSPDLMPEAVEADVDLYLAGHTHGGQIRLPLFGALFTSSEFWKRYEAGLYQEGRTTLYVSRGLGMEGLGAPRARFLSPPEMTLLTLRSAPTRASRVDASSR